MITIPLSLIDRADLSITQRAIIPYIIRHSFVWGGRSEALDAPTISNGLRIAIAETIEALDDLAKKEILIKTRRKTANGMMQYYQMAPLESIKIPDIQIQEYHDKSRYLNLSREKLDEITVFAKEWCLKNSISEDVIVDFELYQRSQNRSSYDWCAEFERFARAKKSKNELVVVSSEELEMNRPTTAEFDMAKYLIGKLSSIDPQFKEPLDIQTWGRDIKYLIEVDGYSLLDVKKVIDWLFSIKGDWFRPNVIDAKSLRKHFPRLVANTRSFRDARVKLPEGVNLFDLYDEIDD